MLNVATLQRSMSSAMARIERFKEQMPGWKNHGAQQHVENLETAIKRMNAVSKELKTDIAEAKSEIAAGDSTDDVKWKELQEEAVDVLMMVKEFIEELENSMDDIPEFLGSERADRCHLIVRDAASVMKKTVRLSGLRSIDCFAHQLQLAVYSGLRKAVMIDFDGVLEKIKKFIRKLRKSGVERQEFIALQQLEEIPPRWLKKGIEVRWNSLHDMIERFLENKAVIDIFCMDKSSFPKIAPAEYLIMQKMVDSLQPIKKATVMLQGRNVTISSVIPTIFVLRRALNDCGTEVSTAILLNLEERVEGIEENADYVVATLLDPKFKADFIEEPQQVASRELLKTKAEKMLAVVLAETTVNSIEKEVERSRPEQNNNSADFFEKYRCSQMPIVVSSTPPIDERMKLALEIEEYFRTPADPAADAITFWIVNQSGNVRHVSRSVNRLIPLEMEEEEVPEVIIDSDNRPIGTTVDAVDEEEPSVTDNPRAKRRPGL
ncbi:hypothetical protein QR680_016066 [Steinernema hermaphroditum]|uniref:Uncharacterized protein n=1 Tax=Steinernema hermaphroditum TaxID=289476 RepID=A0AA39LLY5_9BILA|nr:hypothetical protein QR680_016066 [Steinernema hermaphroditum]